MVQPRPAERVGSRRPSGERIRASSPSTDSQEVPLDLEHEDGVLTLHGVVPTIRAKRRAVRLARRMAGVERVVDRIAIAAIPMADWIIRARLRETLMQEPDLDDVALIEREAGVCQQLRTPPRPAGALLFDVERGIVTFEGSVPSRAHQRLAGVLAWEVPGCRNVIEEVAVSSLTNVGDDLEDCVRMVLRKHPLLDAKHVRVASRGGVVTLTGSVESGAQRQVAEHQAWFVSGVEHVVNHIDIVH